MAVIENKKVEVKCTHISTLKVGDTVLHDDKLMTIGKGDIKRSEFMGLTLFGDSYALGHILVSKVYFL